LDAADTPLPSNSRIVRGTHFKALTHGLHVGRHENPTIPALVNVPTSETYTFAVACQRAWKEPNKDDANKVLVFR
jgi:hypothetical protein